MPQSDPHHHARPVRRLTRRATLGSAAAFSGALSVSLAGCEWGPPDQVSAPAAKKDADEKLAHEVAGQIGGAFQLVEAAPKSYPALTVTLAPLLAVHRAHLLALAPKGATAVAPAGQAELVSGSATTALAEIRSTELGLQKRLISAAGEAVSGDLARTFASMAAAVAQLLAITPTTLKGDQ